MELLIHVHASFIINDRSNSNYYVRLYDKDIISDDFLEEEKLNADGKVHFTINPTSYRSTDFEQKPDFYLTITNEGEEIFRTPVASNINLEKQTEFDTEEGLAVDLGTFVL